MIEAVAAAAGLPAEAVRRAAKIGGGIAAVAASALTHGADGLGRYAIALFQPLAPMLAQPADDIADAMARIPMAALEWKLDGARVQVHKRGDDVRIYTRTGNDVTAAAPEIVSAVRQARARDADPRRRSDRAQSRTARPTPSRTRCGASGACSTSTRCAPTMPLSVFFFDCLRRDDEDLVPLPGTARFEALTPRLPSELLIPAAGHERSRRRPGVLRRRARARTRGRDGQGTGRGVRSRAPAARSGSRSSARTRSTSSSWPRNGDTAGASGLAVESAPRRDRSGERTIRHARQDVQGHDRCDARAGKPRSS